ncbi:MAG: hypothetical protein H7066_18680, partial [Cytophagaceae bacterium]|nr:hypothetical protein [Gemmatimonadaceae bacterium]
MIVPAGVLCGLRLLACLVAIPATVHAQAPRLVWRGLIGETALEVRVSGTDVLVGAAGEDASVSAAFRASEVRQFVDSLARRLTRARARDTTWALRVEEPGVSAGAMSLSPAGRDDSRQRVYRFFLADDIVAPVRQQMTTREVTLLLRTLREASARPVR